MLQNIQMTKYAHPICHANFFDLSSLPTVMHTETPPLTKKPFGNVPWSPPTPGKFIILFVLVFSTLSNIRWVLFNRNICKKCKNRTDYHSLFYHFQKPFSYIMSNARRMVFYFTVSNVNLYLLDILKSIRYSMVKLQNVEKKPNLYRIY